MNISALIIAELNSLFGGRVYEAATPDDLEKDANGRPLPFALFTIVGGQDSEYVDQTMGTHSNARVQIQAVSPSVLEADSLIRAARDKLLASEYTVGVYGSPVGTYDAARKLHGRFQQLGIWYRV